MNTPSLVTTGLHALLEQESTTTGRRQFLRLASSGAAALGMMSATAGEVFAAAPPKSKPLANGADNFYTSDQVTVRKVSFKNQYQMTVAGNLFVPKGLDRKTRTPAIVVGHPMGAVKEQSANLYATKMAEQGFVTLSIDLPFWGGSEGQPRNAVSPDMYAESFSAQWTF